MFQMLKVKHATDILPLLRNENGIKAKSESENLAWVKQYFQNIFIEKRGPHKDQELSSTSIGNSRLPTMATSFV